MTTDSLWFVTGRRKVAHLLENRTFARCGVMPLQQSTLWSPLETRRYYENQAGEWLPAGDQPHCRRCLNLAGAR